MSTIAYIGLGSNVGDRKGNCLHALKLLRRAGPILKTSSFFCTAPMGFLKQRDFINAVVELKTNLSPKDLLAVCHSIEDELKRNRQVRWGPRTIDLDILLYGNLIMDTSDLTIPHPLLASRGFVLIPLYEIAPQTIHPVLQKSVALLLHEMSDTHRVVACDSQE